MGKTIGIMGGTFNPFHTGHLRSIEYILRSTAVQELYIIPTALPPHKEYKSPVTAQQRLEMAKLAVSEIPYVFVSNMEILRGGKSYTIDTVKQLKAATDCEDIYLFIGTDMLYSFDTWKQPAELCKLCKIRVLLREIGEKAKAQEAAKVKSATFGGDFEVLENEVFEANSTQLRARLKKGENCEGLIPKSVLDYIYSNGLYR